MSRTFKKPLNFAKSGTTKDGGLLVMVSNFLTIL